MERQLFEVSTEGYSTVSTHNETIMGNAQSASLKRELEKYDASLNSEGGAYSGSGDTREESNFLYLSKPSMRLELHGLDMKMAAGLTKGVREIGCLGSDYECGDFLLNGVTQCLQEAASVRDRVEVFDSVFFFLISAFPAEP